MLFNNKILITIEDYLKFEKTPLICIVWPTAIWKTSFAIELLSKINWELINADSRQIYKWIECITWLNYDEIKNVKNHLFWVYDIKKIFTLSDFLNITRNLINEIHNRWNIPIIVWWTWLFISSLIEWFEIPDNSFDENIRLTFKTKTNQELYDELIKIDPNILKNIHINNRIRIERALEIYYVTWKKMSEWIKNSIKSFNPLIFSKKIDTESDREYLYNKINQRQKFLFEQGISEFNNWKTFFDTIEELKMLNNSLNKKPVLPALNTIWISEILSYLLWDISKEDAIIKMQKLARNYAKRQLTWWRNKPWIKYI